MKMLTLSGSSVALNLLKVRSRCTSHRGEVAAGRRQLRQRNSTPTSESADGQKSPQHRIRRQPRRQESHPTSYHIQEGLLFESPAPTVVGIAGCCSVASVASRFQFMRAPLRQVAAKALAATPLGLRLSHGPALRTRACATPPVFLGADIAGN